MASSETLNVNWRKSSKSGDQGACVEVAGLSGAIAVRDSKDPDGPRLTLGRAAFASLLARTRRGHLDL